MPLPGVHPRALENDAAHFAFASGVRAAPAYGKPHFRRTAIIGHQFVNADWNKFKPTNSVSHRKFVFT